MSKENPKGVPPVTPKSISVQKVGRGEQADTGGNMYDRMQGRYGKNQPVRDEDPYAPYDNY